MEISKVIADLNGQAAERYRNRAEEREKKGKDRAKRNPFEIEPSERARVRRSCINPRDGLAYERVMGKSDLVEINYLDIGLIAAKAVCRIQVRDETSRMLGYGTGFLVSSNLLLTNNHVLPDINTARRSLADFNFEDDAQFLPEDTKTFVLDPDRFYITSSYKELDFTVVAVKTTGIDGTSLLQFGHVKLREDQGKIFINEYVSIIQHPEGAVKQVALRENKVIDIFDNFVHYKTDTRPGSSGSPVFSDQWEVVALHHAGVEDKDSKGNTLSTDGTPWTPAMGEDKIAWKANEGIRISSIFKFLREAKGNLSGTQQGLLDEMLLGSGTSVTPSISQPEIITQKLEWYAESKGYDPDFLGETVPLPIIPASQKSDVVKFMESDEWELKYTHFSLVMSKKRRLAFFTAVNIDGNQSQDLKRVGDKWYYDPRIDEKFQCGPELYVDNKLDRGHLVRRLDPVWGVKAAEANEDTFHFTNCSPQHKDLNQRTWQNMEDYILKNAKKYGLKVTVFTGPVFRNDDMIYRNDFLIPEEFWKVVAVIKDDGRISATAYLQTQKNLLSYLEFAYGKYRTYQVPVNKIESLIGLDFGHLRDFDPIADAEMTPSRVIERAEDIRL